MNPSDRARVTACLRESASSLLNRFFRCHFTASSLTSIDLAISLFEKLRASSARMLRSLGVSVREPLAALALLAAIVRAGRGARTQRLGAAAAAALDAAFGKTTAVPRFASTPEALKRRRLLLVDDNELNRIVAVDLLAGVAGAHVVEAHTGVEALRHLGIGGMPTSERFDLVLMDVQMPDMDGLEATRRICAHAATATLPVLGMTARALPRDRAQCLDAGMNEVVVKPFVPNELFGVIARWLPSPLPAPASPAAGVEPAPEGDAVVSFELGLTRCPSRHDLYLRVVRRFLDTRRADADADADADKLRAAHARGGDEAIAHLAHTTISTAGAARPGVLFRRRVQELAHGQVHQGRSIAERAVGRRGNDQQLPLRQPVEDLGRILDRREVVVAGDHQHREGDGLERCGLEHYRRHPQPIRLDQQRLPVAGSIWGHGLVLGAKARRQVGFEDRRLLCHLRVGPGTATRGLVGGQVGPQVRARDHQASHELRMVVREQQSDIAAIAFADDVDRAQLKIAQHRRSVVRHRLVRERARVVGAVPVPALVDADHRARRHEHASLGGEVTGEVLQAAVQEQQGRSVAFELDVKPRPVDLHELGRTAGHLVGNGRRGHHRAYQCAGDERPAIHGHPRLKQQRPGYPHPAKHATQAGRPALGSVVDPPHALRRTGIAQQEHRVHAATGERLAAHLSYAGVNDLVPVLRPLIGANNTINANAANNTLVITDYANNLARLGELIAALDTPSATDVAVIPLEYALASDLATRVLKLSNPSAAATPSSGGTSSAQATPSPLGGLVVLADTHSNVLLVKGATPARLAAIRALVARLDRVGASRSNIHVVYLKYADAVRLATVLRAAFASDASRGAGGGGGDASSSSGGRTGGSGGGLGSSASGSSSGGSGSSGGGTSQETTAPIAGAAAPSVGGFVQADPASNALIVTAAEPLYRALRATIDELDTRRAQLVVESVVVEVDASKALDVGLQWKSIFNIASDTSLTLGTVAQAIQATSGTNILSTANLVTLDNEEARIVVGQNVPFVTGSYTSSSSSTTNPFQTIERKDVGITLRIRPQIGTNGTIRMGIYQESSSVASTAATGTESAGPTTNKRAIETNVVVDDGKIIVLGGLIEDSYSADRESIPALEKIPYVGALFRNLSRTRKRTNLLVFLRPVIMRDSAAAGAMTLDRYDYIRAGQQQVQQQAPETLPGDAGVWLPADPTAPMRP
jgi:general secretion pathway protein D